jgi:hypothetical protein
MRLISQATRSRMLSVVFSLVSVAVLFALVSLGDVGPPDASMVRI